MNAREIGTLDGIEMVEGAAGFEVDTIAHYLIDDVYTKVFVAKKAGTFIGQHSHAWDHGHLVASGAMRVFIDGQALGDYGPGEMIEIKAGKKHVLLALEDNTVGCCIHNTHGLDEPKILERA